MTGGSEATSAYVAQSFISIARKAPDMADSLPHSPFAPSRLLAGTDRHLLIGVNGELVWIDADSLTPVGEPAKPFPGEITTAAVFDDGSIVATWVDRELAVARMATIEKCNSFENGVDKPTLRAALRTGVADTHGVAGAAWSRPLRHEPLALCLWGGDIIFASHFGGIYRTTRESQEVWRAPLPEWPELAGLKEGEVVVWLASTEDSIWAFSLAGGWARLDPETGTITSQGILKVEAKVERAWHHDGEWMLSLSNERLARARPEEGALEVMAVGGLVHWAEFSDESWWFTGWREDIHWSSKGMYPSSRADIGIGIVTHPEKGMIVLTNTGEWTSFAADAPFSQTDTD